VSAVKIKNNRKNEVIIMIGYSRIVMSHALTERRAERLLEEFQRYSKNTGFIEIQKIPNTDSAYKVEYVGKNRGVAWIIWLGGSSSECNNCELEAIINPQVLADSSDLISVSNETHIPKAVAAYNSLTKEISEELPVFADCFVKQINHCFDLDLQCGFDCNAEQILELIQREGGLQNFKTDSVNIKYYSRFAELSKKHPGHPDLEKSRHIIRFEIQCKCSELLKMLEGKVRSMTHSELLNFSTNKFLLSNEMSRTVISKYLTKIISPGDYYSMEKAIELIKAHHLRYPHHEHLIDTLECINRHKGIDNVYRNCEGSEWDEEGFCRGLQELSSIPINLITIPRKWGIDFIPNPLRLCEEELKWV
jgi:uncharacterized protein YfcZ (UPF0381/DUF406 family)